MSINEVGAKVYNYTVADSEGKVKTIRRPPARKLHDLLPLDKVELKSDRSHFFEAGEDYVVKTYNAKHPNVIQLKDDEGHSTWVPYSELNLKEAIGEVDPQGKPEQKRIMQRAQQNTKYLQWP